MLILPHKSGVRCRLNIIFKRIRPNQTCKSNEQREMWNARMWGNVGMISNEGLLNTATSSTQQLVLPGDRPCSGAEVWGRTLFIHTSMSPTVFTEELQCVYFSERKHFVIHSMALQMECCWCSKGWLLSGIHRRADETKLSSHSKGRAGRSHQMHFSVNREEAVWTCSGQTCLRTTRESSLHKLF